MTADHQAPVLLSELMAGTSARLREIRVDTTTRSLLRSIGLTDGAPLRVCQPGDPCIIQVRATRIGMSKAVARCILVVRDEAPASCQSRS